MTIFPNHYLYTNFIKTMYLHFLFLAIIILSCCNLNEKQNKQSKLYISALRVDTIHIDLKNLDQASLYNGVYDSLAKAHVDTSTLYGKREWIMNHFLIENAPSASDFDTLFDINYDGYKDYVIGYYAQAGTGIKNRIKVFFYEPKKNNYILNEQLSDLPNPTFYINQKKITGFYIGNGGGGGGRLEWINNEWTVTKEFNVHCEGDTIKWNISFPIKKKEMVVVRPFQIIPPKEILETDIKWR